MPTTSSIKQLCKDFCLEDYEQQVERQTTERLDPYEHPLGFLELPMQTRQKIHLVIHMNSKKLELLNTKYGFSLRKEVSGKMSPHTEDLTLLGLKLHPLPLHQSSAAWS